MISEEQVTRIRHLFHAEHWKIGTIAAELGLHPDTVRAALDTDRFRSRPRLRDRLTDPYLDFLRQTLQHYPRLRATRLFEMIRPRGYTGSISQLRRVVAALRPPRRDAFLRLRTFPAEQAHAHCGRFGDVANARPRRSPPLRRPPLHHPGGFQPSGPRLARPGGSPTPLAGRRLPHRRSSLRGRTSASAASPRSPFLLRPGAHRARR